MRPNKIFKAGTIALFLVFIAAFIAFKTGAFENFSASGRDLVPDTPQVQRKDTLRESPAMMPTSKSMVVIPQDVIFTPEDTTAKTPAEKNKK